MPGAGSGPGSSDGVPISVFSRTVTLTNDQIKALPTTAVEVVPAPGAGQIIVPIYGVALCDFIAGAYDWPLGGPSWQLMLGSIEWGSPANVSAIGADTRLVQLMPAFMSAGTGDFSGVVITGPVNQDVANLANVPLFIKDDYNGVEDYTGGNAANTLKVTALYTIIDV